MKSATELDGALRRLAEVAWRGRRVAPHKGFVLQPAALPTPSTSDAMRAILRRLYDHARIWTPGFEVPFHVPQVKLTPSSAAAGVYRVDPSGYISMNISPEFVGRDSAVLTILAHSSCHHILDLSGLRDTSFEECERLTHLAAFVCGFGEVIIQGQAQVKKPASGSSRTHLGSLSSEEYRYVQGWVLHAQGIGHAESYKPKNSTWSRLRARVRRLFGGSEPTAGPAPSGPFLPAIDRVAQLRRQALLQLGGDQGVLDRLTAYERRRMPAADESALLDAVMGSLERDRR